MDSMVTLALVGTAHQERVDTPTGTPIDDLMTAIPANQVERKLLLTAAALSIYRQAGYQPRKIATLPAPAAPENLRACSPSTALLLARLLQSELLPRLEDEQRKILLQEGLDRLAQSGMYLPCNLLPLAFSVATKKQHSLFLPVLGERGRWLSQFNPDWSWARDYISSEGETLPADAETIWQEGTAGQRVELLRRLRTFDSGMAREWLEGVWKQEKAEIRCDFLQALEIGLSGEDEAFLEKALDDRASSVRAAATTVLLALPNSALSQRMSAVASSFLYRVRGKIVIDAPMKFDKAWLRDGIEETVPKQRGERSWWLTQILARVDLAFWEAHLLAEPEALITEVTGDRWGNDVIVGWSQATRLSSPHSWIMPLWHWWGQNLGEEKNLTSYLKMRTNLLRYMTRQEAEESVLAAVRKGIDEKVGDPGVLLSELSRPWSIEFSRACLHILRLQCTGQEKVETTDYNSPLYYWFQQLATVALALPFACLDEAQRPWKVFADEPVEMTWAARQIQQNLQAFLDVIHLRKQIYEEIL